MKKVPTSKIVTFGLLFMFFALPVITHAQPGFGDDVDDVPLDGGLSLLVALGVGYGAKKIAARRKI